MSNVRRGAVALAIAAIMSAVPQIAWAQGTTIARYTVNVGDEFNRITVYTCGPDGFLPTDPLDTGDGEEVSVTGTQDWVVYMRSVGGGEQNMKFRVNTSGSAVAASGRTYRYTDTVTSNSSVFPGSELLFMSRAMLTLDENGPTPDDLVVRIFFHVVADASGVPHVQQGRFEMECK